MNYEYIEVVDIEIHDKYYTDGICEALKIAGYHTALIYNGINSQKIRILKEVEKNE